MVGAETTNSPRRHTDHRRWLAPPGALPVGPRPHIDGVFQAARHRTVVFRGNEQHRIAAADFVAKTLPGLWRCVGLDVLVVQRQIADLDDPQGKAGRRQFRECAGDLAVVGILAQATDDNRYRIHLAHGNFQPSLSKGTL
ncbi:hypothetical protein D3C75_1008400 [compost metagenome]